jgi:hypothetical protein
MDTVTLRLNSAELLSVFDGSMLQHTFDEARWVHLWGRLVREILSDTKVLPILGFDRL